MTDRDTFAAAALTGFASQPRFNCGSVLTLTRTAKQCYELADAMLRERAKTNHDAAPAARASEATASPERVRDRGDAGTGDTPKPINDCVSDRPKPIASEQEPVAWGVVYPNDEVAVIAFKRQDAEERATASDRVVPLYRKPTLTDAERDDICVWLAECLRQASTATEGANEELAERWTGRAKRAAAMIERLGGVE